MSRENKKFRLIFDHAPLGIFHFDRDGVITECNDRFVDIIGSSRELLLGLNTTRLPDKKIVTAVRTAIEGKKGHYEGVYESVTARKSTPVRASFAPVHDDNGLVEGGIGIIEDVSGQHRIAMALQESEKRFRTVVEHAHDGIYIIEDHGFSYVNRQFTELTGYSEDELLATGFDFRQLLTEESEELVRERIEKRSRGEDVPGTYELSIQNRDGEKIYVEVSTALLKPKDPMTVIGIMRDVTERKRTADLIRQSLSEKEVLLSEIHHRVKNNMAVISSILTLQSEYVDKYKDPEKLFQDTQNRIRSMALVHELVYESKNFARIDFGRLLHKLLDQFKNIYCREGQEIQVKIDADPVLLDIHVAIPLSLFTNEAILNAYKHAFDGVKRGNIKVALRKEKGGFLLAIEDDGVGVEDLSLLREPASFGYTIMHGLVRQLRGTLAIFSFEESSKPDDAGQVREEAANSKTGSRTGLRVEVRLPL